jgi:hypothetical protein
MRCKLFSLAKKCLLGSAIMYMTIASAYYTAQYIKEKAFLNWFADQQNFTAQKDPVGKNDEIATQEWKSLWVVKHEAQQKKSYPHITDFFRYATMPFFPAIIFYGKDKNGNISPKLEYTSYNDNLYRKISGNKSPFSPYRLSKWRKNKTIRIGFIHKPRTKGCYGCHWYNIWTWQRRNIKHLENKLEPITQATGLRFRIQPFWLIKRAGQYDVLKEADILIYNYPLTHMATSGPGFTADIITGETPFDPRFPHMKSVLLGSAVSSKVKSGDFFALTDKEMHITKAACSYASLETCMLKSLGLFNALSNEFTFERKPILQRTDMRLLKLLYSDEIKAGMTMDEALPILKTLPAKISQSIHRPF